MTDELEALGAFATAGLIVKSAGRKTGAVHDDHQHETICANCGAALTGPYCHVCGQRAHVHRSLLHMGEELVHGIAHFDGKVWHTLPLLAFKPGKLTRAYIDGKRATHVSPMGLFLFVIFLMFLVFSFARGTGDGSMDLLDTGGAVKSASPQTRKAIADVFAANAEAARQEVAADTAAGQFPAVAAEAVGAWEVAASSASGAPIKKETGQKTIGDDGFKVNIGIPVLDEMANHFTRNPELAAYKLKNTAYKFSFLLVPISLPFIWLLFFWRRDVMMYDHAVFALYSLSFMSLLVTAAVLIGGWDGLNRGVLGLLVFLIVPIHMYKQLKYTYGLTRFGATWRTFAMLIFSVIALSLFASAILAVELAE